MKHYIKAIIATLIAVAFIYASSFAIYFIQQNFSGFDTTGIEVGSVYIGIIYFGVVVVLWISAFNGGKLPS